MPGSRTTPKRIGRYLLSKPIASGGMATVHFGAIIGEAGFSRTVAIKRVHAKRSGRMFVDALVDEARLVSRIQHPNVVPTLDVVVQGGEVFVVLEYVVGESLSRLLRAANNSSDPVPISLATNIVASLLHGLHAAHDAKSARGKPLGIVHRDVSPQNVLVGTDGLTRVLDFGIAKATERLQQSREGQVKGKLGYAAPEQLQGKAERRTDVWAAAVVLWEMLANRRLFYGPSPGDVLMSVLNDPIVPPSRYRPDVPAELDAIVLKGLDRDPEGRYASARHFAVRLEQCIGLVAPTEVGHWVQQLAGEALSERAALVAQLERDADKHATTGDLEDAAHGDGDRVDGDRVDGDRVDVDRVDRDGRGADPGLMTIPELSSEYVVSAASTALGLDDGLATKRHGRPHPAVTLVESSGVQSGAEQPDGRSSAADVAADSAGEGVTVLETVTLPAATSRATDESTVGVLGGSEVHTVLSSHPDAAELGHVAAVETSDPLIVPVPVTSRRWPLAVALLTLVSLGLVVVIAVRSDRAAEPPQRDPQPAPAVSVAPAVTVDDGEQQVKDTAPSQAVATAASGHHDGQPVRSSGPVAATAPAAVPPRPVDPAVSSDAVATSPSVTKAAPKPGNSCDPPFTIDDRGVRRLKRECF